MLSWEEDKSLAKVVRSQCEARSLKAEKEAKAKEAKVRVENG